MNISNEMAISIGLNVISLAFFAGVWWQSQKNLKEQYKDLKESVADNFDGLKKSFAEKIKDWKDHFNERFETLETKQDKHNSLIERMVVVEQSVKSSHHRADDLAQKISEIERKIDNE